MVPEWRMSEVIGEAIAPTVVDLATTGHTVDTVGTRTVIVAMATTRPLLAPMVLGTTADAGPMLTTIDMPAFAADLEVTRIIAHLAFTPAAFTEDTGVVSALGIEAVTVAPLTEDAQ